jgi:hypothetical protein
VVRKGIKTTYHPDHVLFLASERRIPPSELLSKQAVEKFPGAPEGQHMEKGPTLLIGGERRFEGFQR